MGCSLNRRYTHDRRIIKIIDNRALRKHTHYSARSRRSERVSFARYTRGTAEFRVFKKKRGKKHRRIFSCHEAVFRRIDSIQLQESHIPRATTVGGGNWLVKKEEKRKNLGEKWRKNPRWSGSCGWSSGWRVPDRSRVSFIHAAVTALCSDILPWETSWSWKRRIMSKSGDSSAGTTKNPEHESGYFEDGSDVETIVEEPIVIEERNYGSTCYGLSKDVDDFDMKDFNEPVPDYDDDRGTTRYFPRKCINGCCLIGDINSIKDGFMCVRKRHKFHDRRI